MTKEKQFVVYILASKPNGTLDVGVTSNLEKRIDEHRTGGGDGFTARYMVHRLVWYELHDRAESAILRERRMKKWRRA
ncbi:MAG: GIY-YIG nuclease family protein [Azospirillaceae bacterium]